jgi:methionine-rich copper-binding protein CopC
VVETLNTLSKDELILEVVNQKTEIETLKHQISIFQKMVFGSKPETHKVIENPEQITLEFTEKVDLDLPQDIELQKTTYRRKAKNTKRTDYSKLDIPAI